MVVFAQNRFDVLSMTSEDDGTDAKASVLFNATLNMEFTVFGQWATRTNFVIQSSQ